jgi:hypothetical protein
VEDEREAPLDDLEGAEDGSVESALGDAKKNRFTIDPICNP